VTIDYRVIATHAKPLAGTTTARARVIVDGDRVHVNDLLGGIQAHMFAGVGEYAAFEAHFGFMGDDQAVDDIDTAPRAAANSTGTGLDPPPLR